MSAPAEHQNAECDQDVRYIENRPMRDMNEVDDVPAHDPIEDVA